MDNNEVKNKKLIDLHMHTSFSDGDLTPSDLIKHCIDKNIATMAITDHDTIDGIKSIENLDFSKNNNEIKLINGIELSAKYFPGRMHILGYGIDIKSKELNEFISGLRNHSVNAVLLILEQLKKDYNIVFSNSDIDNLLASNRDIGRPDIAKLLIKYNYVKNMKEAFDKYLIESYRKTSKYRSGVSYHECIKIIKQNKGIPVIAHPKTLLLEKRQLVNLLKNMIADGLMGIEVYHSNFSEEESNEYKQLARDLGLYMSGGSDYHGSFSKPDIEVGIGKNNLCIEDLPILKLLK